MKIMKKFFISLLASICSFWTLQAQETAYLFSYFINDSRDGLHLAYSRDGLKWTVLNNGKSYLAPAVGKDKLMRDPSICQAPDERSTWYGLPAGPTGSLVMHLPRI